MTASRGSYEVSLISNSDSRWAADKSQKLCYVCTTTKLSRGKRHHCRMCGNISCPDCCPRICKKCLAENISSISAHRSVSHLGSIDSSSVTYETLSQIQRLCKLKSKQIMWKKVELIDKTYFEPVFIISEVSSDVCIIRTVDGDYYAFNKDKLHVAPGKDNIFDSLQCLIHGYINRSSESSISLKKPLYALQESDTLFESNEVNANGNLFMSSSLSSAKDNKTLKQCNILSFFPMLQKDSYKLNGFIFQSSLTKMNIENVQLFHYVSDQNSPRKIPAYCDKNTMGKRNSIIQEYKANHVRSPSAGSMIKSGYHDLELDSFRTGYQEMRKMYENYVSANEEKLRAHKDDEDTIKRLQTEVEHLTQSKEKYRQAVDLNARQVRELQEQLRQMSIQYQEKLDNQSLKYKDSTQRTTQDAQSQLVESYKQLEEANEEIAILKEEMAALKATKSVNQMDEIQQFRLEKEQQRSKDLEIQLKQMTVTLETMNSKVNEVLQSQADGNKPTVYGMRNIRDEIGSEYNELFTVHHKKLFDMLLNLMSTYRSTWNEEYLHQLIYELLFNILIRCYEDISIYEENVSSVLCKEFTINKDILYESFYSEWIQNSKCQTFLDATGAINDLRNDVMDTVFIKNFIFKHLELNTHQISQEIHQQMTDFIRQCISVSWQMCTQYPLLRFTPNTFNVKELNKVKYHKELHHICHKRKNKEDTPYILYYIWPIISYNNFHSIVDYMKIEVCLGDALSRKKTANDEDINGNAITDETYDEYIDSVGMLIIDHDNDLNAYDSYL
eukprot:20063_1